MNTSLGQYCINVTDLETSIRFYRDAIGLEVTSRTEIPNCNEAILERKGEGAAIQLAHHLDRSGPIDHGNALWKLYVNTDDCAGLYQRAVDAGARPVQEPKRLDRWPVTIAFVEDPDGYTLELVEYHR